MVALLRFGHPPFQRTRPPGVECNILEAPIYCQDRFWDKQKGLGLALDLEMEGMLLEL